MKVDLRLVDDQQIHVAELEYVSEELAPNLEAKASPLDLTRAALLDTEHDESWRNWLGKGRGRNVRNFGPSLH
jgi:hypothetical protein